MTLHESTFVSGAFILQVMDGIFKGLIIAVLHRMFWKKLMSLLDLPAVPRRQMPIVLAQFNKAGSCLSLQSDEEAEKSAASLLYI